MKKKRIYVILLLLSFALLVSEQTSSGQKKAQSLALKISVNKSSLCRGEKVTITLKMINKSDNKIAINSSRPWSFISFLTFKQEHGGGGRAENFTMVHDEISHSKYHYLVLDPKQSYEATEFVTVDNEFFKLSKNYELTVSYQQLQQHIVNGVPLWVGTVDSNKVKLRILACTNR